jgi:acetolactate synthase-1/2/3 large subunit
MNDGASRICDTLEALGFTTVFGLPGTQNVPLFEGLRRSRLRTVLATHELAAAFMASGFFRASGRPAALFTIPGPGFAYALAGLAEARHDSAALLHITGTPDETPGRAFQLQRLDQVAMATPVVKRCFRIDRLDQLEVVLADAAALSCSGEPGPVLVEVAPEVLSGVGLGGAPRHVARPPGDLPMDLLIQLSDRLRAARRPLLIAGQGCAGAAVQLRTLAESLHAPVATTLSGRGILPEDHPLSFGRDLGVEVEAVNAMVDAADIVVVLGCKLSHNGTGGFRLRLPSTKLARVDASAEVLAASYPASLAIQADAGAALDFLVSRLAATEAEQGPDHWGDLLELAHASHPRRADPAGPRVGSAAGRTVPEFFRDLRAMLPRNAIVTTDSGRHQAMAREHLPVNAPRGFVAPSDFQSMGFGLPAAVGAALAGTGRPVVAIVGDGGMGISGLELMTAVRERLALTVLVLNDAQLGLIREQQLRDHGASHAVALGGLDMAALAAAVGAGFLDYAQAGPSGLRAVIENGGVTLVDVRLRDSLPGHVAHAAWTMRAHGRRVLGRRLLAALKRVLRR